MKIITKYFFILTFLFFTGFVSSSVVVDVNGNSQFYSYNPRLSEVLAPSALSTNWYWPATSLYQLDSAEIELLRQEFLISLNELKEKYSDFETQNALNALERQVIAWQLAKRIDVAIDYDFARVREEHNPRLDSGVYKLQLKTRPTFVYLSGVISSEMTMIHQGTTSVHQYINNVDFLEADNSKVTIIQPNGVVLTAGLASWNKAHIEVMPGSQIIIMLKPQLFGDDFTTINERFIELAKHRILP